VRKRYRNGKEQIVLKLLLRRPYVAGTIEILHEALWDLLPTLEFYESFWSTLVWLGINLKVSEGRYVWDLGQINVVVAAFRVRHAYLALQSLSGKWLSSCRRCQRNWVLLILSSVDCVPPWRWPLRHDRLAALQHQHDHPHSFPPGKSLAQPAERCCCMGQCALRDHGGLWSSRSVFSCHSHDLSCRTGMTHFERNRKTASSCEDLLRLRGKF